MLIGAGSPTPIGVYLGRLFTHMSRHPPAAWIEAAKGFRRLKACKQLPILKAALRAIQNRHALERTRTAG
jgi:hypothetical protein